VPFTDATMGGAYRDAGVAMAAAHSESATVIKTVKPACLITDRYRKPYSPLIRSKFRRDGVGILFYSLHCCSATIWNTGTLEASQAQ